MASSKIQVPVSVIMPAFNAESFIQASIESALAQTWEVAEVLVVDDGSTDNTAAIAESIPDSRVKCWRQENATQAVARNAAIERASGEFVAFLDDDDLWEPDKLEKQMPLFDRAPDVGVVYSRHAVVGGSGQLADQVPVPPLCFRGNIVFPLLQNNFITCSSTVVRKSLLDAHQLRLRTGRHGVDDWDLWLRLALLTKFDFVDEALVRYRVHEGCFSHNWDRMCDGQLTTLSAFQDEVQSVPHTDQRQLLKACADGIWLQTVRRAHINQANGNSRAAKQLALAAIVQRPLWAKGYWAFLKAWCA